MSSPIHFLLQIRLPPQWQNVDLLRTSTIYCLTSLLQNNDFCQTVGIVAGELLENAIKYGDWTREDCSVFRLQVQGDDSGLEVEVSNPINRNGKAYEEILGVLQRIREFPTAADAYFARLKEIADAPRDQRGVSRIGLLRIAYEGNCTLDVRVDESDVLHVKALSRP